jgi:hypothetical protein
MAFRAPTGKARTGEQKNQSDILTGQVSMVASKVVNLSRVVKKTRGRVSSTMDFEIIGLVFEDAGGASAETAQRLSAVKGTDGSFTIYAEKADLVGNTWVVATGTNVVRWTALVTG